MIDGAVIDLKPPEAPIGFQWMHCAAIGNDWPNRRLHLIRADRDRPVVFPLLLCGAQSDRGWWGEETDCGVCPDCLHMAIPTGSAH